MLGYNLTMKQAGHPQYFDQAQVVCASCGNKFTTGSTMEAIRVELCSNCHPFYTGEQKFVDSASRIQKFQQKREDAKLHIAKKKVTGEKKQGAPKTLREMLLEIQ